MEIRPFDGPMKAAWRYGSPATMKTSARSDATPAAIPAPSFRPMFVDAVDRQG